MVSDKIKKTIPLTKMYSSSFTDIVLFDKIKNNNVETDANITFLFKVNEGVFEESFEESFEASSETDKLRGCFFMARFTIYSIGLTTSLLSTCNDIFIL